MFGDKNYLFPYMVRLDSLFLMPRKLTIEEIDNAKTNAAKELASTKSTHKDRNYLRWLVEASNKDIAKRFYDLCLEYKKETVLGLQDSLAKAVASYDKLSKADPMIVILTQDDIDTAEREKKQEEMNQKRREIARLEKELAAA